jgi:hypothetical protein
MRFNLTTATDRRKLARHRGVRVNWHILDFTVHRIERVVRNGVRKVLRTRNGYRG